MGWVSFVRCWVVLCLTIAVGSFVPASFGQDANPASRSTDLQSQGTAAPLFEVVSITPSRPDGGQLRLQFTADGFRAVHVTLHLLLVEAFGLDDDQVINEPDWGKKLEYDIEARVSGDDVPVLHQLSFDQRREMFRQILDERFALAYHKDTRQLPVFVLVVGKGGVKIKESTPVPNAAPIARHGPGGMTVAPGRIVATSTSMPYFVGILSGELGRTVVDRTGLDGSYDITLKWTPTEGEDGAMPSASNPPSSDPAGPSLFTAIQEQLGLRLRSEKTQVDVIVIDHVEKPSPN